MLLVHVSTRMFSYVLVCYSYVLVWCFSHDLLDLVRNNVANKILCTSFYTGGDNSNKRCFGTKPKLFRESGDFSGKHAIIPGHCRKNRDIEGNFISCIPKIREDDPNFRDNLS